MSAGLATPFKFILLSPVFICTFMVRDLPTVFVPMLAPGVRPPFVVGS